MNGYQLGDRQLQVSYKTPKTRDQRHTAAAPVPRGGYANAPMSAPVAPAAVGKVPPLPAAAGAAPPPVVAASNALMYQSYPYGLQH